MIDFFGAAIAFLGGALISAGSFALSRYVLKAHPAAYPYLPLIRQPIQIAYPVILWFVNTPFDRMWLLFGGVLGISTPMLIFTAILVKYNERSKTKEEPKDG